MIDVFYDTEFTDLNLNARLISIGCIDETGERSFYAELTDTYKLQDCTPFVRQEVIPHLQGGASRLSMRALTDEFARWIASFGEPVRFLSDSTWDAMFIWEIFSATDSWPENLMRPEVMDLDLPDKQVFARTAEWGYATGLRRHHALDDARANRKGWLAVQRTSPLAEDRFG